MLIVVKKEEAEMLLHSIRELEVTLAEMDGEEEGSHGSVSYTHLTLPTNREV